MSILSLPISSPYSCRFAALGLASLLVSGCGGSAGDASSAGNSGPSVFASQGDWQRGVFRDASTFANKCAVPRTGIDPSTSAAFADRSGSTVDENNFLRSWSNDTYLWYNEITDRNPANYTDVLEYFDLLKTTGETASGKTKDQFHFTYPSDEWYALSETGVSSGYGVELAWIESMPPRNVIVAYTEPGSPAANAGLTRGARLMKIDGVDLINGNDVDVLNEGLFPDTNGEVHTFEVQDYGSTATRSVVLQSAMVTKTPVQNVKTIATPAGKVGYFLFNDHIATAERGLVDAINQLRGESVKDLVLDVRYNGGGALYIASELAYMIAGSAATDGKIFENLIYNDKHATKGLFGEVLEATPFFNASPDVGALPTLNLPRVYMLTSGDTCSASEAIINGLRGVNVEVIQIGSKTCGKPYGFYPQPNCGTTYFTIQFKGVNEKAFGDYADGFVPSAIDNGMDEVKGCSLGDDFSHALGDAAEKNLATALHYRATGTCALPASFASKQLQKMSNGEDYSDVHATLKKEPGLTNRIMNR